jgi:hypothetical protein
MDRTWVAAEAALWDAVMNPPRRRLVSHSLSPEQRKDIRAALDRQKSQEFVREWEAYDRWIHH